MLVADDLTGRVEVVIRKGELASPLVVVTATEGLVDIRISAARPASSSDYATFLCPEGGFVESHCDEADGLGLDDGIELYVRGPPGRVWVELITVSGGVPNPLGP